MKKFKEYFISFVAISGIVWISYGLGYNQGGEDVKEYTRENYLYPIQDGKEFIMGLGKYTCKQTGSIGITIHISHEQGEARNGDR